MLLNMQPKIMEPVTDDEIAYAEKLLIPESDSFNEERRNFLRNFWNLNVQACPGAGKTTVLLAKLLILANRMPFEDKRGICVLTHTNVAIDEIKERLANQTGILFQYPNFFGTFQSFVDKFLAIPACIHYYDCRPDRIDDESYYAAIDYEYRQIPWKNPFNGMLYGRRKKDLDQGKISKPEFDEYKRNTFRQVRIDFVNEQIVLELGSDSNFCGFQTDTGKLVLDAKESVIKNGVLHYDDAYSLALRYLSDYPKILSNSFQKRFSYVFIDEMQDTDIHQNQLIDTLFDSPDVIVQKIGDKNQAIYGRVKADNLWNPDILPINDSKRFHNSIGERVKYICIEESNQLTGNNSKEFAIHPTIIVFDDPKQVLAKYGELIVQHGFPQKEVRKGKNNVYKAIGWVKNHEGGKLSISSYWDEYVIEVRSKKEEFENLNEYLVYDEVLTKKGFKFFKDRIISILIKGLSITGNKVEKNGIKRNYSKTTLISVLKNSYPTTYEQLNVKISDWLLKSINGEDVSGNIGEYVKEIVSSNFSISNEVGLDLFLESLNFSSVNSQEIETQKPLNIFRYKYSDQDFIEINVGTIHSAKGETHTSTLYLETYYQKKHESERLIEFMKGNYNSKLAQKSQHTESLKMAYVGMTRPSHFLCVAMHQSRIDGHEEELSNSGWQVNKELIDEV